MGLITVSGEPGCRQDEIARLAAQRLGFDLVTESRLRAMIAGEFGAESVIPDKAYPHVLASMLGRLATQHHLVVVCPGAGLLFRNFPGVLRVHVLDSSARRVGNLMMEHRLERPAARQLLKQLEREQRTQLAQKFGRATTPPRTFDLVLNTESLETEHVAKLIQIAAETRRLVEEGLWSEAADAQLQFQVRLQLAKHGIVAPDRISLKRDIFSHPSEQIFANLLDFYRIAWEYEPRSFPLQWDKDGKVIESFTPDFYLPELDLYVELTTMKQSLVTRKNRKVKMLRAMYPHLNIQVFYQKDFQNLIFKHGLADRLAKV